MVIIDGTLGVCTCERPEFERNEEGINRDRTEGRHQKGYTR